LSLIEDFSTGSQISFSCKGMPARDSFLLSVRVLLRARFCLLASLCSIFDFLVEAIASDLAFILLPDLVDLVSDFVSVESVHDLIFLRSDLFET
jgi:hypothetical protein